MCRKEPLANNTVGTDEVWSAAVTHSVLKMVSGQDKVQLANLPASFLSTLWNY